MPPSLPPPPPPPPPEKPPPPLEKPPPLPPLDGAADADAVLLLDTAVGLLQVGTGDEVAVRAAEARIYAQCAGQLVDEAAGAGSADAVHVLAETARLAYADRSKHLGDPDYYDVPDEWLMSKAYAKQLAATIDMKQARPSSDVAPGVPPAHSLTSSPRVTPNSSS